MHIVVCIKQVPDSTHIRVHPVTNTIMRQGVPAIVNPYDLFALEEALRLRAGGIAQPILLLEGFFEAADLPVISAQRLHTAVHSPEQLEALEQAELPEPVTVWMKLDTGMHRLGFMTSELYELIEYLRTHSEVKVKSVYSHLAVAEDPSMDQFTLGQISMFESNAARIDEALGYHPMWHILNSAGIERFAAYQMDMVRLGIGLYGVSASGQKGLRNVSTLKTTILQIQNVPAGDSIGYSRMSYVKRDSRIAIIPIGYADGLDRHFSNGGGEVLINGQRCPIIGNICMDACMIDVTDIHAQEGDAVIIFGDELPVSELSDKLKTIPYEILTSISPRVKRVYFRE